MNQLDKFEQVVLVKLEQTFCTRFTGVREAIIYRKRYLNEKHTKIILNWREIGSEFGLSEKQAL